MLDDTLASEGPQDMLYDELWHGRCEIIEQWHYRLGRCEKHVSTLEA